MSILDEKNIDKTILQHLEEMRRSRPPVWGGPKSGITQSLMTKFLECPFRFFLYAYLGIKENEPLHPNLVWGDILHKGLEHLLLPGGTYEKAKQEMWEYANTRYPRMPSTYPYTTAEMLKMYNKGFLEANGLTDTFKTEQTFEVPARVGGYDVVYRGKADGYSKPLRWGGEHKCKGKIDAPQSRAESPIDQQILLYSHCLDIRHWTYDIIRIPEAQFMAPQKRPGETPQNYAHRLFHSHSGMEYPISRHPYAWINQFHFDVSYEQIDTFIKSTWNPLVLRLCRWWDHVTDPSFDLLSPSSYNDIFYITPVRHFDPSNTEKFKCNYWGLLTGETPVECLVPVESFYSELEEE